MRVRAALILLSLSLLRADTNQAEYAQHMQKGIEAQQRRQWPVAQEEFSKAVASDPKRAEPHARAGMVYREAGQPRGAAAEFESALRLEPALQTVGLLLAFTYQELG